MGCGAETEANTLITALTAGKDFTVPVIDLSDDLFEIPPASNTGVYAPVSKLTNADLTSTTIDGSGTFDVLMRGFKTHLREEFDAGRITGAEYTKSYTALVEAAMSNSVQFLLGKDASYWNAVQAQIQARLAEVQVVTARIQLETAKVQLSTLRFEALNAEATYALTKMKLSSESMAYCNAKYQLEEILPVQKNLLTEQYETQRSQTLNTRTDGVTVAGSVGKQKDLYAQQIVSYQRDAEVKAAKIFSDAWITMKTIDEGVLPPDNFANVSLNAILAKLKLNNELT